MAMATARRSRTVDVTLRTLHPAQAEIMASPARFKVLACGRRFGKTSLLAERLADIAIERRLPYGYFAPSYKLLLEVWEEVMRTFRPIIKRSNTTDRVIEFITGGKLEMWSFESSEVARSRHYAEVYVDEAGLIGDLVRRWEEEVRPTLVDLAGSALFAGTPKGRNGFYTLYGRGLSPAHPDWASWQFPTSANPHMPPAEVAAMCAEMTDRTRRQEAEAEFIEDGGGVFRNVLELSQLAPASGPVDDHVYAMGVDWARSNDYTVFSIIDATTGEQVLLDRFSEIGYETQYTRWCAVMDHWQPYMIYAEYNSMGGPLVERAQSDDYPVIPFETTAKSKAHLIDSLALALERRSVTLLQSEDQRDELLAYEGNQLPGGVTRYGAPDGQHDDTVIALALAWKGAQPYLETTMGLGDAPETPEEAEARRFKELRKDALKVRFGDGVEDDDEWPM